MVLPLRAGYFLLLTVLVFGELSVALYQQNAGRYESGEACHGSCYPATGNLLIGREDPRHLRSTSTCGMEHPSQYCIVSHLEEEKKCFWCDSRQPYDMVRNNQSHRIQNVVTNELEMRKKTWWQSQNGVENVSIQIDLEAEFHFTHLIMTFKTFRPSAMLIERSADYEKSWKVYRYFAYDCAMSFPAIPTGRPRNHTDVVCDAEFSDVSPSTGGEVIFKALPPELPLDDPYAPEIRDLLRITNLRINFTKLHTLGDNLLDNRPEISEKYYYAVYDIVVRGSCSCYGHASSCIPQTAQYHPPDMVHGQCDCTHHTNGSNCQECEDFYNDMPWRPAMGNERNECKRCTCNNHATRCHFDRAVFEASGFQSGGVCDDCLHDTMGIHCDQCKPYFYKAPGLPITDPYVCRACECDLRGSKNRGICDSETDEERGLEAGKCHCKKNVDGPRCDRCKNGFWKLEQENEEGCIECTCFLHGTVGNEGCDKETGHCSCKRLVTGDNCERCLPEHWGLSEEPDGCKPCDCDPGGAINNNCNVTSGECTCRPNFTGRKCDEPLSGFYCPAIDHFTYEAESSELSGGATIEERSGEGYWTGSGFVRVIEGTRLKFTVANLTMSGEYSLVLRYESRLQGRWENVDIQVVRPGPASAEGPCHNVVPNDDFLRAYVPPGQGYVDVRPPVCLEEQVTYHIQVNFGDSQLAGSDRAASLLIDSLVIAPAPRGLKLQTPYDYRFEQYRCREHALQRSRSMPPACEELFCAIGALLTGSAMDCSCDQTGSTSGLCDVNGGQCQCKANVEGRRCERCKSGYFGFGPQGCTGDRCDQCDINHWGNPKEKHGTCEPCQCNRNIDVTVPESCHLETGRCQKCLFNTEGAHCENCKEGYFGDAKIQSCQQCVCNQLGWDKEGGACEPVSGQCPCLPNIEGAQCDQCAPNHFNLTSGTGCQDCACDVTGVRLDHASQPHLQCNLFDGQCECKPERGGRTCSECQNYFWGDPTTDDCKRCECDPVGSKTLQCDRKSGNCVCLMQFGGPTCRECARGYTGVWPECRPCGECFKQWDKKLQALKDETEELINEAYGLGDSGVSSVYDKEFTDLEAKLGKAEGELSRANVTAQDLDKLKEKLAEIKEILKSKGSERLDEIDNGVIKVRAEIDVAAEALKDLEMESDDLKDNIKELEQNVTKLRESDVEGAYNITVEAARESERARAQADSAKNTIADSEAARRQAVKLIEENKQDFEKEYERNQEELDRLQDSLEGIKGSIPELNEMVCGEASDTCSELCGGAGCGRCGGSSCLQGAVTKSSQASDFAQEANKKLNEKQEEANELIMKMRESLRESQNALTEAKAAYTDAKQAVNQANQSRADLEELLSKMEAFLNGEGASPMDIRILANEKADSATAQEEEARKLLEKRKGQSEQPRERAEKLRQRATQLVQKTQKHMDDIEKLNSQLGTQEDQVGDYESQIEKLVRDLEESSSYLDEYLTNSAQCQCAGGVTNPELRPDLCPLQ